ncbi:MAG: DUF2127 domain-containing protein [Candidatus Acidiferrales bacterium]
MSSIEAQHAPAAHGQMRAVVLHESFRVSIILKGLHALLETVGGIVLLKVSPQTLNRVVMSILTQNLSRDPHDFIATSLHRAFERLAHGGSHFASWYLLSHGGVKLCLVVALLWNKLWAYPLMILMLSAFIGYQVYRIALTGSVPMILLTIFDLVVIVLVWIEYRQQIAHRQGTA